MIRFRPMLPWNVRLTDKASAFELTPEEHSRLLIDCYQTAKFSPFHQIRINSRRNYIRVLRRVVARHGDTTLDTIKEDMTVIKARLTGIEFAMAGMNRSLDRAELRLDRIERRLGLS